MLTEYAALALRTTNRRSTTTAPPSTKATDAPFSSQWRAAAAPAEMGVRHPPVTPTHSMASPSTPSLSVHPCATCSARSISLLRPPSCPESSILAHLSTFFTMHRPPNLLPFGPGGQC